MEDHFKYLEHITEEENKQEKHIMLKAVLAYQILHTTNIRHYINEILQSLQLNS